MSPEIILRRKRAAVERINSLVRDLREDIGIDSALPNPRVIEGDRAGELQALENVAALLEGLQMRVRTFRVHGFGDSAKVIEHRLPGSTGAAALPISEDEAQRLQREAAERCKAREAEVAEIERKRQAALATARDKSQPEPKRIRASERAANLLNRKLRKERGVSGRNGR